MSDPLVQPDGAKPTEPTQTKEFQLVLVFSPQTGETSLQTNVPSKVLALGILEVGKALVVSSKPTPPTIQTVSSIRDFLRRKKR